jgi:hypothetical protein
MKRTWSIHRCFIAKANSQTRWDQGYQQLLRWTTQRAGERPSPAPLQVQEDADADCVVCAGLDHPASPGPNH